MTHAALGWALAGTALLIWPSASSRVQAGEGRPGAIRPPLLYAIAAGAAAASSLALLGPVVGAVVSLAACPVAVLVVRHLPTAQWRRRLPTALPLALDLAAAALRAGQPPDAALALAAPAAGDPLEADLLRVAGLLRLGAEPEEAWRVVAERVELQAVAAAARRSSTSGIRLAGAFEEAAVELRDRIRIAGTQRAARCGVHAMAPLALCFLPAFVCLGIVPAVVGIASGVLGSLP